MEPPPKARRMGPVRFIPRAAHGPGPPVPLPPRVTAHRGRPFGSIGITGYTAHIIDVDVLGEPFRLRVLSDLQQYADPDGDAERAGISSSQWPLFGQLWPSGQRLAEAMQDIDVAGRRVLELGCGIGLASLVLQRRGAEVMATDVHPLAETFLAYNAALNGLDAVRFRRLDWTRAMPDLGRFDLIIAGDVLYERGQAEGVAAVIAHYAADAVDVVVTDAGRGYAAKLERALAVHGIGRHGTWTGPVGAVATLRFARWAEAA